MFDADNAAIKTIGQVLAALVRHLNESRLIDPTAISDDLMKHWMQQPHPSEALVAA